MAQYAIDDAIRQLKDYVSSYKGDN
jgi:hypothetical protein